MHRSASSSVRSQRSGRSANKQRIRSGGFSHPSAFVRVTLVRRDRDDPPHALQRVGDERVGGLEVADRVRGDRGRVEPVGEPQHRVDLTRRSRLDPVLDRHDAPVAPERLTVVGGQRRRGVDAAGGSEPPGVRPRAEQDGDPRRVRADLFGRDPWIAARTEQVGIGQQPAEVRVPGVILGEEHDVRIGRALGAHGDRSAEDRRTPSRAHAATNRAAP